MIYDMMKRPKGSWEPVAKWYGEYMGKEGKAIVLAWEISTWLQMPDEHQEKNGVLYVITTSLHEGIKPASTEPLSDQWKTSVWQALLQNRLNTIYKFSRLPRSLGYKNTWRETLFSAPLTVILQLSNQDEREDFFRQWLTSHVDTEGNRSISRSKQELADFDRRLKEKPSKKITSSLLGLDRQNLRFTITTIAF